MPVTAMAEVTRFDPPRLATRPVRVVILSASVGGGHLGPARELASRLTARGASATVVDLLGLCPGGSGAALRAAYRALVGAAPALWGRMFDASDAPGRQLPGLRALVALAAGPAAAMIAGRRGEAAADVVVSTYPFGGHLVAAARRAGCPPVPLLSYVTDPGVHGLWLADGTQRYLAGWPVAAAALRRLGAPGVRWVDPLVRPEFRPASASARSAARARWHLPAGPLALVLSGSWGVGDMAGTTRDLVATAGVTPVVVCGHNRRLYRKLIETPGAIVLGWVADMASLMRACDTAVLNSGGLSLAEAESCGLPVIHYRALPGQGVANAAAAMSAGTAAWAHDKDELAASVRWALERGVSAPVHRYDAVTEVLGAAGRESVRPRGRRP